MVFGQLMSPTDWCTWGAYTMAVAIVVFAKSVLWFRGGVRDVRAALASWVGLQLIAMVTATGLGQWRGTGFFAALVSYGLASAMIVSAAVNAAFELGLRNGREATVQTRIGH